MGHAITVPLLERGETDALADLFDGRRFRATYSGEDPGFTAWAVGSSPTYSRPPWRRSQKSPHGRCRLFSCAW